MEQPKEIQITDLPDDILLSIIAKLPFSNSGFLIPKATNRQFNSLFQDNGLWANFTRQFFPEEILQKYINQNTQYSENLFLKILRNEIQLQKDECKSILDLIEQKLPYEKGINLSCLQIPFETTPLEIFEQLTLNHASQFKISINEAIHAIGRLKYMPEAISLYCRVNRMLDEINILLVREAIALPSPKREIKLTGILTRLPEEAIDALVEAKIQGLDLAACNLSWIPRKIGEITTLEALNLRLNSLRDVPLEISNLTNLKALNVMNNRLRGIPAGIWNLTALELLFMGNFKPSLTTCICCEQVGLRTGGNIIKEVPSDVAKLVRLKRLGLPNVQLESIDPAITSLQELDFMNLCYNNLSSLPITIASDGTNTNLPKLTSDDVWIINNPLATDIKNPWFGLSNLCATAYHASLPIQAIGYSALNELLRFGMNTFKHARQNPLHYVVCLTSILLQYGINHATGTHENQTNIQPVMESTFSL